MLATALVAATLAGCGSGRDVEAFAEQMTSYLQEREAITEVEVSGQDEVLVTITLAADLSEIDVVEEVWAVTHHELDAQVPYGLQVRVAAAAGDGTPALAAFHLEVTEPAPDGDAPREEILLELDLARALVGLGAGETTMTATSAGTQYESGGDPLYLAREICYLSDDVTSRVDDLTVSGPTHHSGHGSVTMRDGSECDISPGVPAFINVAGQEAAVESFTVVNPHSEQPEITLTLADPTSAQLAALETFAERGTVALTIEGDS